MKKLDPLALCYNKHMFVLLARRAFLAGHVHVNRAHVYIMRPANQNLGSFGVRATHTQMQTDICKHSNRFQIIHLLSALTFAFRLCEALFASRDLPGMRVTQAKAHVPMYDMKASTSA